MRKISGMAFSKRKRRDPPRSRLAAQKVVGSLPALRIEPTKRIELWCHTLPTSSPFVAGNYDRITPRSGGTCDGRDFAPPPLSAQSSGEPREHEGCRLPTRRPSVSREGHRLFSLVHVAASATRVFRHPASIPGSLRTSLRHSPRKLRARGNLA